MRQCDKVLAVDALGGISILKNDEEGFYRYDMILVGSGRLHLELRLIWNDF